jgi:hypothetical protein
MAEVLSAKKPIHAATTPPLGSEVIEVCASYEAAPIEVNGAPMEPPVPEALLELLALAPPVPEALLLTLAWAPPLPPVPVEPLPPVPLALALDVSDVLDVDVELDVELELHPPAPAATTVTVTIARPRPPRLIQLFILLLLRKILTLRRNRPRVIAPLTLARRARSRGAWIVSLALFACGAAAPCRCAGAGTCPRSRRGPGW